jgi:hypothetical protein
MTDAEREETDQASIAPTDIVALVRHVTRLCDDLEKVWSDALDPAKLEAANEGLGTRLGVALAALAAQHEARDAELRNAGVDIVLPDWPPSPEFVLSQDSADPQARWRLVMVAQLQALELLVEASNALAEPSGVTTDLRRDREVRRWWESGAFALLRSRARLVERLTHELDAAEAALLREEGGRRSSEAYDAFQLAATAYRRGDPEAALLHGLRGPDPLPWTRWGLVYAALPLIMMGECASREAARLVPSLLRVPFS